MVREEYDNVQLSGIYWDNQKPSIFLRKNLRSKKESTVGIKSGKALYIAITGDKYCIGYFDIERKSKIACPHLANLTGISQSQCRHCQRLGATFFAISGKSTGLTKQEKYLISQPHLLYLSLFGDSLVKVGVAAEYRKLNRIHEQGASASLFIARGNGDIIRKMEREISRAFGVTERVNFVDKLKRIKQEINPQDARSKLLSFFKKIHQGISEEFKAHLMAEPEFSFNLDRYGIRQRELKSTIKVVESMLPNAAIAGKIVGIPGNCLLLVDKSGGLIALNSKLLQGYIIQLWVGDNTQAESKGFTYKGLDLKDNSQLNLF